MAHATGTQRQGWITGLTVAGVVSAIVGLIVLGVAVANPHADIQNAWSVVFGAGALGGGTFMVLVGLALEPGITSAPAVGFAYWTVVGASTLIGGLAILSSGVLVLIAGLALWAIGVSRKVPQRVGVVAGAGLGWPA